MSRWSSEHEWVKRATAWDVEQDRLARAAQAKAVKEMNERQAKIAVNVQGKMLNALNRINLDKIKPGDVARLLDIALKAERVARGADARSQQSDETKPAGSAGGEKDETVAAKAWIEAVLTEEPSEGQDDD